MPVRLLALVVVLATGCAPLAAEHRADAAFRHAITAQLRGADSEAEPFYREIISLGFDWSPVWNNLAVIAAHHHEYRISRKLLAQAVRANAQDVVALTNYGVMSFYLADLKEAARTLAEARALRRDLIDHFPSLGGGANWDGDRYARVTAPLDETAARYLAKIARAQAAGLDAGAEAPSQSELLAALSVHHL
jgi:hypothetical protein